MKEEAKSEKQKLLAKGNFGTYHKPLANKMGIEAALILNQLIDKYDYWVNERGESKKYGKHKAFFITYKDLSENGKIVSEGKLNRDNDNNPLVILEKAKLIKRKLEWFNFKKMTYYILFFDNIAKTFDSLSKELKEDREDQKKDKILREMEQGKERGKEIDDFLKQCVKDAKMGLKTNGDKKLQNNSMETVESSASKVQNIHITKNKIIKNKSKKYKQTQEKENSEDDIPFIDEEIDNILNPNYSRKGILNSKDIEENSFDPQLLYKAIFKTRTGVQMPQDFFNTIVNLILKDKFKGFRMSVEDELLIYNAIVNNPLFELENEDIEERDEEIDFLKIENENITQAEIDEEIYFEEDRYEHLYTHLWEKIMRNCYRIIDGKLEARFGNIFVGVNEMSENYAPLIERY